MIFSIVTPSFNRAAYLDETIASVVSQRGDFAIDYVVQDGGSEPDVLAILAKWERAIREGSFVPACKGVRFRYFVEPDSGMYDALNRGFAHATGDVMAWINTDDFYLPSAFASVMSAFALDPSIRWLTGLGSTANRSGTLVAAERLPPVFSRALVGKGLYSDRYRHLGFGPIPQESTFWRRNVWEETAAALDATRRYAGDFVLWQKFSEVTDLVKLHARLAAFRFHGEQLTTDINRYLDELPPVARRDWDLRCLRLALRFSPRRLRRRLLNLPEVAWLAPWRARFARLYGRGLTWSFEDRAWRCFWDLGI